MTIELLHYNFKLRYNEVDSQSNKDFNPAEIDELINNAHTIWVDRNYSGNNSKRAGFEEIHQTTSKLSGLTVKFPEQVMLAPVSSGSGVFEFNLEALKYPFFHIVRVTGKIANCTKKVKVTIVQHDDMSTMLEDALEKPSIGPFPRILGEYGKSSTLLGKSALYLYSDGTFNIDGAYIEYLKIPTEVSIGGYSAIDGTPKVKVESDLPGKYHSQIIDIAVDEARRIMGDLEGFKLSSQKQLIND